MLQKLKENIGYYFLERKITKVERIPAFLNLEEAKTIGIIAHIVTIEDNKIILEFVKWLQQKNKQIHILVLLDNEELTHTFPAGNFNLFFSKKNLSWFGKPRKIQYESFIQTPFDILIDTTLLPIMTIQYIFGLSKARFKVGKFYEEHAYADFMIRLKPDDTLPFFIEQIKHYLTQINQQ